jgi:hypothetical protein
MAQRDALIAKLREDFPLAVLVAAMGAVLQRRRERAGISTDIPFRITEPEKQLDEFLQSSTTEQLKILRKIAWEMGPGEEVTDPAELAMLASLQRKQ